MYSYEIDADDYKDYCDEYAKRHPIRELGQIIGYIYPNGYIKDTEDYEDEDWEILE